MEVENYRVVEEGVNTDRDSGTASREDMPHTKYHPRLTGQVQVVSEDYAQRGGVTEISVPWHSDRGQEDQLCLQPGGELEYEGQYYGSLIT